MERNKLVFKRWTKKPYAAFVSLKSEVRIGVLSLGCSLLMLEGADSYAQVSDTLRNLRLHDVEVVAERQQLHADLSRVVTVVADDEIKGSAAESLGQLLRQVPGVDVRQRGAGGTQADISMRGGSFDQMLVLINGVNVSDPQTGHYALDIPIDLKSIDRIEILQGPASRSLGPNAFSGAINIITGTQQKSSATLSCEGGSHKYTNPSASGNLKTAHSNLFGAVSYARSDGYADNTDYDILNAFAQFRNESRALGRLNVQVGFQNKGYGALLFYSLKYPDQYEHTTTMMASASTKYKLGRFVIEPQVYWREHLDKFELFRFTAQEAAWYENANFHQTDVGGADIKGSYFSAWGRSQLGVSYKAEHILSNVLGEKIDEREVWFTGDRRKSTGEAVKFDHEKMRHNVNVFVEQSVDLRHLSASLGGAVNYNNDFGVNYTLGGDVSYGFGGRLRAFASVNQALRLPTFTDLYYSSADHLPNADLKPERSLTAEAGLKLRPVSLFGTGHVSGGVSVFYRWGQDIIDWVKRPDEEKWHSMNHTEINAAGGSVWAEYSSLSSFVRQVRVGYDFTNLDKETKGYLSQYALDYLKHKAVATLRHKVVGEQGSRLGGLEASWMFSYNVREGSYTDVSGVAKDYDPFALLNVRLTWKRSLSGVMNGIELYAEGENVTDRRYYDYGGIRQAGVTLKGGVVVGF